jgi:hypothetical protein
MLKGPLALPLTLALISASACAQNSTTFYAPRAGERAPDTGIIIYGEQASTAEVRDIGVHAGWAIVDEGVAGSGKRFVILRAPFDEHRGEELWKIAISKGVNLAPFIQFQQGR